MRITQIKQILEIERCTSISQAARNLYISQPGLSALLAEFEAEVGVQIFHRTKRGVHPTKDGLLILESMRKIMKEINFIENFSMENDELTGTLSIMVGSSYEFLFPDLIQRFKKNFPKANLQLLTNFSPNVPYQISKGQIDFALLTIYTETGEYITNLSELPYNNLTVHRLKDCHSFAIMNKSHALADYSSLYLSDLANEQIIFGRQYPSEQYAKQLQFNNYPITDIDRITIRQLLDEDYGVMINSSPFPRDILQLDYPDYNVIPVSNDLTNETGTEFEWPTYFICKENNANKLYVQFQEEIMKLLDDYGLFL